MTMINDRTNEWTDLLSGEMLFLGLLGKILFSYPNQENIAWFQSLLVDDVFAESPFAAGQSDVRQGLTRLQDFARARENASPQDLIAELGADYTQLFACAGKLIAPPWESVYFDKERLVRQGRTLQVRRWYRRFGLVPKLLYQEPDDHIGMELLFAAHLSSLALQAQAAAEPEEFDRLVEAQRQFLCEHLLQWGHLWCNQVDQFAQTGFYRGIGLMIRGALAELAEVFAAPEEA